MNRAISSYSDASSIDEETLLQQELSRLQRQYRIMENERKANCLNAKHKMMRQQTAIKQLENEMNEIETEMKLASSCKNKKQDNENSTSLKQFMNGQDEYSKLISKETDEIQSLDRSISEIEEKINAQHRAMGGVKNSHQRHATTQHTIRVLENRLNKATREFNDMLAKNAKLREEIQHLRSQRGVFDTIHKRLYKDLVSKKREQLELIEQSTMAFDQRDEAEQKMATLADRNQKDLGQYNMEYKELVRQLDHDTALKKFLLDKAQERWELAESRANERKKSIQTKSEKQAEKMLKEYLNAFKEIKKITGEERNEKLVERYMEMEDQNFAMFSYVNEINDQLEKQHDQIRALENEIMIYKADAEDSTEKKKVELEKIQGIYNQKAMEQARTESEIEEQERLLEQLRVGIKSIFDNTGCSADLIKTRLGVQNEVTHQNIMDYLAVIEDMANEMVKKHIVTSGSNDSLAAATVHNGSDDVVVAPNADETSPETDDLILDIKSIRSQAVANIEARERERASGNSDKPQMHIKDNKNRKTRK